MYLQVNKTVGMVSCQLNGIIYNVQQTDVMGLQIIILNLNIKFCMWGWYYMQEWICFSNKLYIMLSKRHSLINWIILSIV